MTLKQIGTFFYLGGALGGVAGFLLWFAFTDETNFKILAVGMAITLITTIIAFVVQAKT